MNIPVKSRQYSVFALLLTIIAIITLGRGSANAVEREQAIDPQAVEPTHEESLGPDNGAPIHEKNTGKHYVESMHEGVHEADESLEITLNAVEGSPGTLNRQS